MSAGWSAAKVLVVLAALVLAFAGFFGDLLLGGAAHTDALLLAIFLVLFVRVWRDQ